MKFIATAALALALALGMTPHAEADRGARPMRALPTCQNEDGSYRGVDGGFYTEPICVWNARKQGNRRGRSYVLITQNPDTRYAVTTQIFISHKQARRLTNHRR